MDTKTGHHIIQVKTAHIDMTGTAFIIYGQKYRAAAITLLDAPHSVTGFDPVPYFLLCQSLELHLKSFLWLEERVNKDTLEGRYGHNLGKLWSHAKAQRIDRYTAVTLLRDRVIKIISPYYKEKKLSYLDIGMVFRGYDKIRSEPQIIPVLKRLTHQLDIKLRRPILSSSQM